ncbi:UDP-glucose--tetrahydrobiopterin glucosyltransferase [filamentous cyanobacterium CCP5]|nr:UDP-glucose--tetrahydrobiopterin glucosyltransferase [filamentous cyanobacterium CCP5]
MAQYRLLFVSTPVGPLGSGLGGGVELTLVNLCQEFQRRGHLITVVAPKGSHLPSTPVIEIAGQLQPTAHTQTRATPIVMPDNSVLGHMWNYVRHSWGRYDLVINFAYDWLPFYLTPFLSSLSGEGGAQSAIAHFITMGSLTQAMDTVMAEVARQFPDRLGVYTQTQAQTFPFAQACRCLGSAIDLERYHFGAEPEPYLAWLGRISPEKGLEDAVAAADQTGLPLKILGKLEDIAYWESIRADYPQAPIEYLGFLETDPLQAVLRQAQALLMTPRWVEAFGNVAIEAMACGVPVIAYCRGGPAEIVRSGQTGWLVEPDSVPGLVQAIGQINQLDRQACRYQAETEYSLRALGDRFEAWFESMLAH